jgi:hypothetical protein
MRVAATVSRLVRNHGRMTFWRDVHRIEADGENCLDATARQSEHGEDPGPNDGAESGPGHLDEHREKQRPERPVAWEQQMPRGIASEKH